MEMYEMAQTFGEYNIPSRLHINTDLGSFDLLVDEESNSFLHLDCTVRS